MPIVGGLDIHRKQITFDYLDTATRGGAARPDRPGRPGASGRVAGAAFHRPRTRTSRWRAAPGGGMSPRNWPRPGSPRMSASRPTPPRCGAASGTPRPTRPTPGTCGSCWPTGGCRSAGSRRRTSWNAGRCWSCTTTCGPSTPPGCSGSTRCCSTRARRSSAGSACAPARAWPRCGRSPPRSCRRPGSCRSRPPWTCWPRWRRHLDALRRRLLDAARHLTGAKELHARLYGVGPITALALVLLAGRRGPVLLRPQGGPVRRAGRHRLVLRPQGPARAPVPAGTGGAALVRLRGRQDPRPRRPPPTTPTTRRSRTGSTASAPPSPRPARSSGRPCHILAELGDDALGRDPRPSPVTAP